MKRALAVFALVVSAALAEETAPQARRVWCNAPPRREAVDALWLARDGKTALLVTKQRVEEVDLERREVLRRPDLHGRLLALCEGGERALVAGDTRGLGLLELTLRGLGSTLGSRTFTTTAEEIHEACFSQHRGRVFTCQPRCVRVWGWDGEFVFQIPGDFEHLVELGTGLILTSGKAGVAGWSPANAQPVPIDPVLASRRPDAIAALPSSSRVVLLQGPLLEVHDTSRKGAPVDSIVGTDLVPPLAVSPQGDRVLVADRQGAIHVFDEGLRELAPLLGHAAPVRALAISGDGKTALSSADDGTLVRWDLATARRTELTPSHREAVTAIAASSDGDVVLTGSDDQTVRLWNAETGEPLQCFRGHEAAVLALALSRDGRKAASSDTNGWVFVWDVATLRVEESFHAEEPVRSLRFTSRGELLHRGCPLAESVALLPGGRCLHAGPGKLDVEDSAAVTEKRLAAARARSGASFALATEDGRRAFVAFDEKLLVVDLENGSVRALENAERCGHPVAISPDGKLGVDSEGNLWRLDGGFVVARGFRGSAVAFVGSRALVLGQPSGRLERFELDEP
jgi:WD40 repeat protein